MNHKNGRRAAGPDQGSASRQDLTLPRAEGAGSLQFHAAVGMPPGQIVFIDGAVPDAQLLAAGVKPGVVAVVLDPNRDELQQIALYLAGHADANLDAIDIVAHGSDGALKLGDAVLDANTMPLYASDLAAIGAALRPGGAIQLFGCDVAQDATGMAFLQQLSDATGGASIAAATHLVGAASGGGSWTLNADIGTVTAAGPFTAATLAAYPAELTSAPTGNLWLGSWNGLINSAQNQIDAISVSGTTSLGTSDIADTLKSGDSALSEIDGLAVDPARGQVFVLSDDGTSQFKIYSLPAAGGAVTPIYTAPDTTSADTNVDTGTIGGIAVDEVNSNIYFTQSDYDPNTGAQIAADTGVFVVPESGGAATQVVNDVQGGTTLTNPTSLGLDLPNNLAFFLDNVTYNGGTGTVELYAGSLTTHSFEAVLSLPFNGPVNANFLVTTALAVDTTNHVIYFSTEQPGNSGVPAFAGIYSVHYTPNGTSTTIGSTNTLYAGPAAQSPQALAVDPANGLLYVSGTTYGNSGSSDAASAWVGSTSGSGTAPLTEIFQLGGETLNDFSYTSAAVFEATPSLTASGAVTFVQGGAAVTLDPALTVTDESEPLLASATVSIAGYVAGDTLSVGTPGGLSQGYSNGTLTLTGIASLATYQTALDSVAFSATGGAGIRTIDWTVSDGIISSATPTSTVTVHVAPTVTSGGVVTFSGGGTAVTLDAGVAVSDPSSASLSSATVTIGGFISGDTLAVATPGGLGTAYSNGVLTLTGAASLATYQTALESITYSFLPGNGDPTGGGGDTSRTISWVVNDGVAASTAGTSTLETVHVAPTATAGGSASYAANAAPVTLDAGLSVSDPDSGGNLTGATVAISGGFLTGDTLNFADQNGIAGSYDVAHGVLTLGGTASIVDYQAALQSVTYSFSGDPTAGGADTSRTISWSVSDGVSGSDPTTSSLATLCFCTGTLIATPHGEAPVETLQQGDLVLLADGGAAPVRWIGRHTVSRRFSDPLRDWPIRVHAGALAEGLPRRDLLLSPGHGLRVGTVLANASALANGSSVVRERHVPETFVYWHVELDTHAVILAEGTPAETFLDGCEKLAFDNRASRPEPPLGATELTYPRCKSPRQLPRDLREALAARAALIHSTCAAA